MNNLKTRLPVKYGLGTLPPMTTATAKRYGEREFLTKDLRDAGFVVSVFQSDPEIHGSSFYRINIGKTLPNQAAH